MTSFVAVNPNNSYDSRVFDQLLFLEKLKHTEINCEMTSSFINSSEFNSILKEFKRKRQKEGDQKKWETFLEKRQQEEVNKVISGIKATFQMNEYQELVNNNVNCESPHSISNSAYCDSGTEYTSHWLEDNHLFLGKTFHDYQINDDKLPISHDLNDSSISMKNDYQSDALIFTRYGLDFKNYGYNDEQNITKEMQFQYTDLQNEKMIDNLLNATEKNIAHCNGVSNISKLPENQTSHKVNTKINDRKGESVLLLERNTDELQSEETTAKENYCKNIAKRIQDIPGVDTELRKVEDIRIKMTPILSNIRIVISKSFNSPLSAEEDLERIKQRTLEFGARFKRNYLYRTNCQVNKLKEMMPSPILVSKKSKIVLMIQKLTAVHHAAIQALQVIEKQLQTISIFGKTQELLCSFYNCIYELTLILKPFYGYLKTQVLDEVEKHLMETIKLLSELKSEETFSITNRGTKEKKGQSKSNIEPPSWMKKSAALARLKFGPPIRVRKRKSQLGPKNKVLEPEQSKDSINSEQGEKLDHDQDLNKPVNFMMSVKQRPGAELRRANFNPIKTEEPKTMIEMISREGTVVDNFIMEPQTNKALPDIDPKVCSPQTSFGNDNKLGKIQKTSGAEITEPSNVKLIYIKSEDDDQKENMGIDINFLDGNKLAPPDENVVQYEELIKYRRAFKKYKKNIPLYEKNTLNTVVSMSETFLEETITEVSKEINKMKISDLLGIVDEIETCEPDLDSSI